MTQHERIVQYCRDFGSITPMEAFRDLGITKLATRISEMQTRKGIEFKKQYITAKNRYGEPVCYMQYELREQA